MSVDQAKITKAVNALMNKKAEDLLDEAVEKLAEDDRINDKIRKMSSEAALAYIQTPKFRAMLERRVGRMFEDDFEWDLGEILSSQQWNILHHAVGDAAFKRLGLKLPHKK